MDLGVICAVLSSSEDIPVPSGTCLAAEVGLSGEIRPISRTAQRIDEAAKMGMRRMVISKRSLGADVTTRKDIEIIAVSRVDEAFKAIFG
jgi:DNA repair protein RadA/Sms